MKNFKKLTALAMAATMLVGGSLTVFAAGSEGTDTGKGEYEGYVDETSVFSVVVPTAAQNVFNFFVDPNGLLEKTDYERLGATAADFEQNATLFFTRATGTKYGKDSDAVTFENQSSYAVDVQVSAYVDGIGKIALSEDALTGDEEDPTLYLAIVHDTDNQAITANGGALTGTIAGVKDNFEIKYNSADQKYEFVRKADGLQPWQTYAFNLTGACGGNWDDEQAEAAPEVVLTWKVTDPLANEAPSIAKTTYAMVAGTAVKIPVDLGAGELGATGIKSISYVQGSGKTANLETTKYSFSNGVLTISAAYITDLLNASITSRDFTIIFNDAASTKVVVKLRTAAAPSVAATTYTMVSGMPVDIPVDLGAGELAATGIQKISYTQGSGKVADLETAKYSFSNGVLTISASYVTDLLNASITSRDFTIIFNDEASTTVTVTLQK